MVKVSKSQKTSFLPQLTAIALLIGTVIGAGILGLPYVFSQAGFWGGTISLIIIALATTLMSLYFGEVCLRNKEVHHLAGFAKKYLGNKWKYIALLIETVGIYAVLIAYLIGIGMVAANLFGGTASVWSTLFFVIVAPLIYFGFERTSRMEFVITMAKILALLLIIGLLFPASGTAKIESAITFPAMFLPVGILIFSFMGYTVIPEIKENVLKGNKKSLWKVILIAMAVTVLIYFVFNYVFAGNFGNLVSEIGTNSLTGKAVWIGALFVLLTLVTPFIALSAVIKNIYIKDFGIDRRFSWFLAAFIPYIIFLYGGFSFVELISFAGALAFGLLGIITVIVTFKARQQKSELKPEYIVPGGTALLTLTGLIFAAAVVYHVLLITGFL